MERDLAPGRLADTLQGLCRHWEEKRRGEAGRPATPPLTVALARDVGVPDGPIAREVGARLGWPVYDHELVERIAGEMGLRTTLLDSVDEKRQGWLQEAFKTFLEVPTVSASAYAQHLIKTLLALGAHGECVLVGRGAAHALPAATTLRVRLTAPEKDRARALGRELGLSPDAAARRVEAIDRERRAFVRDYFFKDPTDLRHYDLVVNCARFAVADCAALVVTALRGLRPGGA